MKKGMASINFLLSCAQHPQRIMPVSLLCQRRKENNEKRRLKIDANAGMPVGMNISFEIFQECHGVLSVSGRLVIIQDDRFFIIIACAVCWLAPSFISRTALGKWSTNVIGSTPVSYCHATGLTVFNVRFPLLSF